MIKREKYLSKIIPFIDKPLIKVLIGVRRSGKTVLLSQICDYILSCGVPKERVVDMNFESFANRKYLNPDELYAYVIERSKAVSGKRLYLFFDEIQEAEEWQKVINSLAVDIDCDVYITGSNSNLLSGELATYIANTLIFIIVGIVISEKVSFSWSAFGVLILIYIFLNLFRYAMISMLYPVMKRMGYGLTKRESVILTWGGLRGALAMTLALMVSYTEAIPEDIRNQILFFTAGIVTLTLCINATTMRWLLNKLGLISVPSARVKLEYNIHKHIRESSEKYLERLKSRDHLTGANWRKVEHYMASAPVAPIVEAKDKDVISEIKNRIDNRILNEKRFVVCHDRLYGAVWMWSGKIVRESV